jgi:beta-barrel assembly-enhancing protease
VGSHIVAMRSYRSSRTFALVMVFLGLASCATTGLPPIGAGEKPFQMEEDERYVWRHAEQIERQINKSGILYEDYQLEAYLNAVAQKLVSSQVQASGLTPRIRIIKHPLLNAFALPNGTVYLHTGMLARMENEAQLATVLGHEMTHFLHRHTVKEMRSAQNKVAFLRVLQVMLTAGAATYEGGQFVQMVGDLTGQMGAVWALASVRGYSRELETEAYEEASRLDSTYADPHRELGLLYWSQNRPEPALAEFERYLTLRPKAVDAPIIQGYVATLRHL